MCPSFGIPIVSSQGEILQGKKKYIDIHILRQKGEGMTVYTEMSSSVLDKIMTVCEQANAHVIDINYLKNKASNTAQYKLYLRLPGRLTEEQIIDKVLSYSNVRKVTWKSF